MHAAHGTGLRPSDWVQRWEHLLPTQARVLDLACGQGRHFRWLAARGHRVTGVDRDALALQELHRLGETICADLENAPWPLGQRSFDAVVITHYLWRPLWADILASLTPGGVLIYETFAAGNETVGKPSRPDFLLQPGELLRVCQSMHVVAYENGFLSQPERFVQRIVAVAADAPTTVPIRHPL